ncbi:MAG TPA: YicC family protein [Candidatus Paceibacterota bacterium]|nr:YicC family protein [Verrucomicrobiota bacterium]HRZ44333.1 YicC family protein [Candidatus Paceibacterota bacterium]HRZ93390.1 YicC family protein [Candidatus Paceibacterota bacterium]
MNSMTGYGRGECSQDGSKITVELSSVNRKQSEIVLTLPRELDPLEPQVRDEISRWMARGRLTARVALQESQRRSLARVRLNSALACEYARQFRALADRIHIPPTPTLETILRSPGVLEIDAAACPAAGYWPMLRKALRQALADMAAMRAREGAHLSRDLGRRMAGIRKAIARIRRLAPRSIRRYRRQLADRLRQAGLKAIRMDDPRLQQEIVLWADRTDIAEELTRLESHCQQYAHTLPSREPVGRTLDFLAQEMNREVNTIGSKANDAAISREVILLKAELERFREQAQNIE